MPSEARGQSTWDGELDDERAHRALVRLWQMRPWALSGGSVHPQYVSALRASVDHHGLVVLSRLCDAILGVSSMIDAVEAAGFGPAGVASTGSGPAGIGLADIRPADVGPAKDQTLPVPSAISLVT